jgi:hypothetical protein
MRWFTWHDLFWRFKFLGQSEMHFVYIVYPIVLYLNCLITQEFTTSSSTSTILIKCIIFDFVRRQNLLKHLCFGSCFYFLLQVVKWEPGWNFIKMSLSISAALQSEEMQGLLFPGSWIFFIKFCGTFGRKIAQYIRIIQTQKWYRATSMPGKLFGPMMSVFEQYEPVHDLQRLSGLRDKSIWTLVS